MHRPPHDEVPITNGGGMPNAPHRLVFASRKWLLMLVMFVLGAPVFLVMIGPPIAGGWILWHQYALYRDDGRWREFSFFELTTLTLDKDLAANLRWPGLAVCDGFSGAESAGASERSTQECPQLGPAQFWLLHPPPFSKWPGRVAGVFRAVPVSSALFFLGLVLASFLRLGGLDWKLRPPPPALPAGSSAASQNVASGSSTRPEE
jgi:hypothetical protein